MYIILIKHFINSKNLNKKTFNYITTDNNYDHI